MLQRVIPSWCPLELDPCEQCEGTLEQSVAEADKLKVQQGVDKVGMASDSASRLAKLTHWHGLQKNIKSLDDQGRLGAGRLPLSQDPQSHFVIPKGPFSADLSQPMSS